MSKGPAAGLNLGLIESDRRVNVEENRRLFLKHLGAEHFALAALRQVHSTEVVRVVRGTSGALEYQPSGHPAPPEGAEHLPAGPAPCSARAGDALLTDQAGLLLSVRTADCLPVMLVDPRRRVVAAVHAGWRGALERIVEKTVGEMQRLSASRPRDLLAAIGPSIRACCYEVGEEVVDAFRGRFPKTDALFLEPSPENSTGTLANPPSLSFLSMVPPGHHASNTKKLRLNLVAVVRDQLQNSGLQESNIEVAEFCTACRTDLFYSHRKEGSHTGRLMAVIAIRPEAEP